MALVDYPDSEEEEQQQTVQGTKSLVPPPPANFHDLYAAGARAATSDDPGLHGGKKRVTPHVEGVWPSHIYIEWIPTSKEAAEMASLFRSTDIWHSLLKSDLGVPLPLHISLSRSLALQTAQRDDFKQHLNAAIRSSGVRAFNVSLNTLKTVSNHEGTRAFLVLGLDQPLRNELNRLLHACNASCASFGFPKLYNDAKAEAGESGDVPDRSEAFHFSIAWSLTDIEHRTDLLRRETRQEIPRSFTVACPAVKLKMGNGIVEILLKS